MDCPCSFLSPQLPLRRRLRPPSGAAAASAADGRISRRAAARALALTAAFPLLGRARAAPAPLLAGPPARTVLNGVLSGYGLPTLRDVAGFSALLEQYGSGEVVQFLHPSAWVVARGLGGRGDAGALNPTVLERAGARAPQRGRASGLTVGDYRRAEGLALFVSAPGGKRDVADWPAADIAELVTPGDATGQDPEVRVVRDAVADGKRTVETRYDSTTASGYSVERRAITRAVVLPDGSLFALCGSCSVNRWKKVKDVFDVALDSFQVYKI